MRRRALFGALLAPLTVLALLPAVSTAQAATPTVAVFAGTGSDGPLVNNVPATTAQLWGPTDVATTPNGDVYIADAYHHQVRKIGADGLIQPALGTGVAGCDPTGGNVLVQPKGLATDAAGNVYISNTVCGLVERLAPDGTVTVVGGRYDPNGNSTPVITDGMPATQAWLNQPAGLDYVNATNTLYIADQYSGRVLKVVSGTISVVAGTGTNGFSGDGGPATAAALQYPRDVLYSAGKLYIADASNCRVRAVGASGVITTLIGNGACSDSGDVGPASSAGLAGASGLAEDASGNVYVASSLSGTIRKLDTSGIVSTVTQLPGGLGGIALNPEGDLLVADAGTAQNVYKISGLAPPANLPTVVRISPADPQVSDPMLTRGVYLLPLDNGVAIDHYVYGWSADPTATKPDPDMRLQTSRDLTGRLDYRETSPNADWYLFAQAFSAGGVAGPWSPATKVHTPSKLTLLFGFDSVTAGHHNDYGDGGKTTCHDERYGYAPPFVAKWMASIPTTWRAAAQVLNVAQSGFALKRWAGAKYITGTVLDGGRDSCGNAITTPPITDAVNALKADGASSWSQLISTGGINGTNWASVLPLIISRNLLEEQLTGHSLTAKQCGNLVANTWDGASSATTTAITDGTRRIINALRNAQPNLRVTWLGYYNASGTGSNRVHTTGYLPATCEFAFDIALGKVRDAIKAGLPSDASFVEADRVMRMDNSKVQPLLAFQQLRDGAANPAGWPHPNQAGGNAIAGLLRP